MGQAKRRKAILGDEYGRPIEEQVAPLVRRVSWNPQPLINITTGIDQGDCMFNVAIHYVYTRNQPDRWPEPWRIQAGTVLLYDNNYREWDSCWVMGHVWLWREGEIFDPSIPDWPQKLKQLGFVPNLDALTQAEQGVADPKLLLEMHRLDKAPTINGCSLLYFPGTSALDCAVARKDCSPTSLKGIRDLFDQVGELWLEANRLTRETGDCSAVILESLRLEEDSDIMRKLKPTPIQ